MSSGSTPVLKLKSVEFRREREASWAELEALIELADRKSLRALSAAELSRLPVLYRAALSSLSVARAISLDRNVIEYLEALTGRAYFVVYGVKRRFRDAAGDFLLRSFPAAVRKFRFYMLVSALLMLLGTAVGFFLTLADENRFYSFVSTDYAQGRNPTASTAELRAVLYDQHDFGQRLADFAAALFTHNAQIGMLAFALGFVAGVPALLLMFINGLIVGAFAALYHTRGLTLDLWGWLLPHGVTELTAVIFCGGAGLVLGQALLFPGEKTRLSNLGARGREAGQIVLGCVVMLFVAGLIEGIFRQTVQTVWIRYTVAIGTAVLWILYFTYVGRERARGGPS